jgi:carbon-monoxide dehydrogenase small subunit
MTTTPIRQTVTVTVNGQEYTREVPTYRTLVDFIRYDLGLTGTKEACSVGVCGACTIELDGSITASCITLAVRADGANITTIEGVADGDALHPVQEAFINYGGFQCGACTPGQIMAAKALLETIPHPTEPEIKEWMMGNLCRCTGYDKIIRAVLDTAEQTNGNG